MLLLNYQVYLTNLMHILIYEKVFVSVLFDRCLISSQCLPLRYCLQLLLSCVCARKLLVRWLRNIIIVY